jgi:hypothetical protein
MNDGWYQVIILMRLASAFREDVIVMTQACDPPYREHLSQAFARFFMRVGLPQPVDPSW